MRTVLKSLLNVDSDPHAATVVASRVAFALELMCQQPEHADRHAGSSEISTTDGQESAPHASRSQAPASVSKRDEAKDSDRRRVAELATPRGAFATPTACPSTRVKPGKGSKAGKGPKPTRIPFVPVVSSSSAAAAAESSARSARRSRAKQLRLFPDTQPGSASKGDTPGYLRERSLETRQERRVRGNAAQNFAATTMAACWRGYVARTGVARVRAALILQHGWRLFQSRAKLAKLRETAAHRRRARELALEVQRAEAEALAARQREELEWRKRTQQAQEKLRLAASQFGLTNDSPPQ